MIVRLTKLVINDIPIRFDPFVEEIPDRECGWDGGRDHLESLLEDDLDGYLPEGWFIDDEERLDEVFSEIKHLDFDYDFEYEIICA